MNAKEIYAITPDAYGRRILPNGRIVRLGDDVTLGNGVALGNHVTLGDRVTLGNGVALGDGVTYKTTPLQIQCHPYIVYPYSKTKIGVGCVIKKVSDWSAIPEELTAHPECLPWSEYKIAIQCVAAWMKRQ